ncbi:MAG: PorT family protein [Melioribacteraceae bacterium]|nr:PorT family protein [Melioribacteraceae bacterium]
MKKYLLIILLFTGIQTQGQVLISLLFGDMLNSDGLEFGLEGGFNWSKISEMETNKSLGTFNLGFYFDIRLKNQWSLYTGVLVKSNLGVDQLSANDLTFLGTETYPENGDYAQEMRYFFVPALLKYNFENKIYIEAGPQFGLMYDAWVEFNSNIDGKDGTVKEYNKDNINRFDAGIMVGAGYKLNKINGMTFGVKYYYGLLDVYKDRSGTKNSSIFLKITVPIGAG